MADIVDVANGLVDEHLSRSLAAARVPIPAGVPGECENCGDDSPRLVDGRCAPCRDGRQRIASAIDRLRATVATTDDAEPAHASPRSEPVSVSIPRKVQVNARLSADEHAHIAAIAEDHDASISAVAGELIVEALAMRARHRKPLVRAAMIRAAHRDDMPLDGFISMLIERGFASYEADAAREVAA